MIMVSSLEQLIRSHSQAASPESAGVEEQLQRLPGIRAVSVRCLRHVDGQRDR